MKDDLSNNHKTTVFDEITFLDKKYKIPEDLIAYCKLINYFQKMEDDLFSFSLSKLKSVDFKLFDVKNIPTFESFFDGINNTIDSNINCVIKMLCSKDILHVTAKEYKSLHTKDFFKVVLTAQQSILRFMNETIDEIQYNRAIAYDNAAETITGSGYRVYTSSLTTLAATTALEYNILKKQADNADRQFNNDAKRIFNSSTNALERRKLDYVINTFIPGLRHSFYEFAFGLMESYITELIKNSKFNSEALEYVDLKHSNELLKNISLTQNIKGILEKAFLACPFNDAVYEKCAELDLLDFETFKTMKKYCPNNNISQKVFEKNMIANIYSDYRAEYNRILPSLPLVAVHLEKSEPEALKDLFSAPYQHYNKYFSTINSIINSSKKNAMQSLILDIFPTNTIFGKTREEITQDINTKLKEEINAENYDFLCSLGFTFDNLAENKDLFAEYYAPKISEEISKYLPECKSEYEKLTATKIEYEKKLSELMNGISDLEKELASIGFFSFSKKKEIKHKIEAAKFAKEKYTKDHEVSYKAEQSRFDALYIKP